MASLFDNPGRLDQLAAGKQQQDIDDGESIFEDEQPWYKSAEFRRAEYILDGRE